MNVRAIVQAWLTANGYDGLRGDAGEEACGCRVGNLMPCDAPCELCRPGFAGPDPTGNQDVLIYLTQEAVDEAKERAEEAAWDAAKGGEA